MLHHLPAYPYINLPTEKVPLVEITDAYDRPLMLVPEALARRKKLSRRYVLLCLRDTKGRIYLQRRAFTLSQHPGLWDVSISGPVHAGESREGAALRALHHSLGLTRTRVTAVASLPYVDSDGSSLSTTFFLAGPTSVKPTPNPESVADGMFLDMDEIQGVVRHQPDMLTPELLWALRSGWIAHK